MLVATGAADVCAVVTAGWAVVVTAVALVVVVPEVCGVAPPAKVTAPSARANAAAVAAATPRRVRVRSFVRRWEGVGGVEGMRPCWPAMLSAE